MMISEDAKETLALLYDVAATAAAWALLVFCVWWLGHLPFRFAAPFDAIKLFKLAWPAWFTGALVSCGVFWAVTFSLNPWRGAGEYGSAAFATEREIRKMGLRDDKGLIFGKKGGRYLRSNKPFSVAVIAPPDSGKTAAIIIPSLLSCGDSMMVLDPKGELYRKTAKRRERFTEVVRFAPAEDATAHWNPLSASELPARWEDKVIQVERVASALYIPPDSKNEMDYWTNEGRALFTAFALYLINKNGATSIPEVRSLALSTPDPQAHIAEIADDPCIPQRVREEVNPLVAKADREFSGIFGSFKSRMNPWGDPRVAAAMSGDGFTLEALRRRPTTIYLCVSDADMARLKPVLSLFFEFAAISLVSREVQASDCRVSILLDEFVRMDRMDRVADLPALSRSYGVRLVFVVQSIAQFAVVYGRDKAKAMRNLVGLTIVFTQNELEFAEEVSRLIGPRTRRKISFSQQAVGLFRNKSETNEGINLVLPQDITSMAQGEVLLLRQYAIKRPVPANAAFWHEDATMYDMVPEAERRAA